jgi:hypothetical protein
MFLPLPNAWSSEDIKEAVRNEIILDHGEIVLVPTIWLKYRKDEIQVVKKWVGSKYGLDSKLHQAIDSDYCGEIKIIWSI